MTPEEMAHYSAALDEIYFLRQLLAYEAATTAATLEYKTFPKSRRAIHEAQIERMRAATHSPALLVTAGFKEWSVRASMRDAGMPQTLTRSQWEAR